MARTTWRRNGYGRGRPQDSPPHGAHAGRRRAWGLLTAVVLATAVAVAVPASADAGVPDTVRFTVEPADIVAGEPFAVAPALELVDDEGNPIPADPDVDYQFAMFAIDGGDIPIPLSCTGDGLSEVPGSPEDGFTITPVGGGTSATFEECTTTVGGAGHKLVGVAMAPDKTVYSAFSAPFDVSGAAPNRLAFATQPIGGTGGATELPQQPVVAIHDQYGNLVASDVTTEVSLALTSDDAAFTCDANPVQAQSGLAMFAGCAVDVPGVYTLTATATDLTAATSAEFVVSAGAPAELEFTTQPGNAPGGEPLSAQPVVRVVDAAGNAVAATVSLALDGDTDATLTCAVNPVAAPVGVATFTGCTVDRAGDYTLVATAVGTDVEVESAPFIIAAGAVDRAVFSVSPSDAIANAPFGTQPVVRFLDAGGNVVEDSAGDVRLALAGDSTGGALSCDANPVEAESGVATFEGCQISAPGSYRLTAVTAAGVAVSAPFNVGSGDPVGLAFESVATTYYSGSVLSAQPRVVVVDSAGNHLTTSPDADVALTAEGGSLDCDDEPHGDDFGATTFSGCVITGSGPVTITATSGTLNPATATLSYADGSRVGTGTPPSLPVGQTFGGNLWANNPSAVVNDVNAATGSVQRSWTDLTVAGIGMPFTLTRAYHSSDETGGLFGPGWSSVFDAGISLSTDLSTATLRGEDGQRVVFTRGSSCKNANAPCSYVGPVGARADLSCQRQRCTATRFDGVTLESEDGRITRLTGPGGHGLTFTYQAGVIRTVGVTTSGAPLTLGVTVTNGRITGVDTPTRSVGYAYDAQGRLTGYTDAAGETTAYAYDDSSRLTTVTDPLGAVRFSVTYGDDGRVATAVASGGPKRFSDHYSWDETTQTSTRRADVTAHGVNTQAVHLARFAGHVLLWQQEPHGATTAYAYDSQLNATVIQDAAGGRQLMTYSAAGDLLTWTTADGGVTRFAYDSEHRIVETTDPNGNVVQTTYVQGQVAWQVPPDPAGPANRPGARGRVGTHFVRDKWGRVIEEQTPTSVRRYEYDAAGNVTGLLVFPRDSDVAVNGPGPLMSYDEAGNLLRTVLPRGRTGTSIDDDYATTSTYDAVGRRLKTTPAGRGTTSTVYDAAGDVVSISKPDAPDPTNFDWDEASRTMTEQTGGATVVRTYDASGQLLSSDDGRGHVTTYVYDLSGRLVAETDPAGITTTYRYDSAGRVTSLADDTGVAATFEHDALHRVVSTTFRGGRETTEYDPAGNVIAATRADGVHTAYRYDNQGRLVSTTDAAGTTTYHYDLDGNLTGVTDGNGHRTTYTNDAAGRRTSMIVGGRTWTYGYDVDSNLVTVADPAGRTTTYTRSPAGDATRIEHQQSGQATITVTQEFDGQGRRTAMTDAAGTHSFAYDAAGNLVTADGPGAGFSFDYSVAGQMAATYPDGTEVTYRLDDAGNVMALDAPGVSVAYLRDRARRVTGIAFGSGVLETRGYDGNGRLVSQALTCGGTAVGAIRYGYDESGYPLAEESTIGGGTARNGYAYDDTGRVVASDWSFTAPSAPSEGCTTTPAGPGTPLGSDGSGLPEDPPAPPTDAFVPDAGPGLGSVPPATANAIAYDAVGNRVSGDPLGSAGYNERDELVSGAAGSAVYDAAGNLVSSTIEGATTSYGYDAAGRLNRVTTPDGRVITYSYDGDGNRLTKAINGGLAARYYWDPSGDVPLLALEEDANGDLLRRYFYAVGPVALQVPGRAEGEVDTYYYVTNARGDVRAITDDAGAVVATYAYGPFGNALETTEADEAIAENPIRFQGQVFDADTGLYNLRARNYDPHTGRFTQRDPVVPAPARPTVTPYAFADNRPTVEGDPTGRISDLLSMNGHSTESSNRVNQASLGLKASNVALTRVLSSSPGFAFTAVPKVVSKGLGVVGLGLTAYVVAEDCRHGPVELCVAGVVGLSISAICLVATDGLGSMACTLAGFGISYVIANYGPLIVSSLVDAYYATPGAIVDAANATADALRFAGEAIASAFEVAGGAVADGFNSLGGAISSGYRKAIATLADAGYSAAQLAQVLGEQFVMGVETAIAELIALAYHATAIVDALEAAFNRTAEQAAALMKQVGYAAEQIAAGLAAAYSFTIDAAAAALAALEYGWDVIAGALVDAYGATVEAVTTALRTIGATAAQVADALVAAFNAAGEAVALALHAAGYALSEIASAVSDLAGMTAEAFAAMFRGLNYTAAAIAGALQSGFAATAEAAASALRAAGFVVDQVSAALRDAYQATAEVVAQALADAGYLVNQIADTLGNVFHASTDAIRGFLTSAGFNQDTINAIGGAFQDAWDDVAGTIGGWFGF